MSAGNQAITSSSPLHIDGPDVGTPLLIMTVDVGNGRQDTITIFPGDRPETLAQAFASKHGLKSPVVQQLEELIAQKKTDASKFSASRTSYSRASSHQSSQMGLSQSADRLTVRSNSAMKPSTSQSRPANYGEWMYQREQKAKDQRRLEQLRTVSSRAPPVKPKTQRPRSASESTELVLLQRGEATQQKIKNLRSKAMEEEMQECTFRPAVNERSDKLSRNSAFGKGQQRFEKLFNDASEKELRHFDRVETAVKTDFPFHPATISVRKAPESQSAMVDRLMKSKQNFDTVISKLKEELEAGVESASTFKPVTGRAPTAAKYERRGPVHEYLYEQRSHKQAVVQKLRDQEDALRGVQPKLAIPRSEELAAESCRRHLELLFAKVDHDQDGVIAFSNLSLEDVDQRTVQLLSPIWAELAQTEETMDFESFCRQMEGVMRTISNEEKNYLLRSSVKTEPVEVVPETHPVLSKASEELASRRREQLGSDIYARRMVEKTMTAERVKVLKQRLAREEMRECTFRPVVNNYKRP